MSETTSKVQKSTDDLNELTALLAELLRTDSGKKELEKLLGSTIVAANTAERGEKTAGQKRKKIFVCPPPYILRSKHACSLCGTVTFEFFVMRWDERLRAYRSTKLTKKDLEFDKTDSKKASVLCRRTVKSLWQSPTYKRVETVSRENLTLQTARSVISTCKVCSTVLSFLSKKQLVEKLILKATKLEETANYVRTLQKLTIGEES